VQRGCRLATLVIDPQRTIVDVGKMNDKPLTELWDKIAVTQATGREQAVAGTDVFYKMPAGKYVTAEDRLLMRV